MSCPKYDFHVHTKYLRCADETMEVSAIVAECERVGVKLLGIADHLNRPDQLDLHKLILADLMAVETNMELYFGVELNFMSVDGPLALTEETKAQYGFQYAIGGIHETYMDSYDLKKLVDIQHRHHLAICTNPLVDVLVHPYWFGPGEFGRKGFPIFDSMKHVPASHVRELGQVAAETNTAIEINAGANFAKHMGGEDFAKTYMEYLAALAEEGPMFSLASDAHNVANLVDVQVAWNAVDELKLPDERIWRPGPKCLNKVS